MRGIIASLGGTALAAAILFSLPSLASASTGAPGEDQLIIDGPGVYLRFSDYPSGYAGPEEMNPEDIASSEILHGYDALHDEEASCVVPPFSIGDTKGEITPEFMDPLIVHTLDCSDPVEKNIKLFSDPLKDRFSVWLQRSGRYVDIMKGVFRERGLPEDLVYIALVESGFNPKAYSRARACGPWQFISSTGRKYGLKYDYWVDERRDPVKSTMAAADYLTDLFNMFGTWELAMASYNGGEGRIARAVRTVGSLDFWKLREERVIHRETREYVPRFLAAKAIAKNPEAYGFEDIDYDEPFEFDTVRLDVPLSLEVAAKCCGTTAKAIKDLNPELRRWCTPPDTKGYALRIPKGKGPQFHAKYKALPNSEKAGWSEYVVRRGDTLGAIADRYNLPVSVIAKQNNIRRVSVISIGQRLIIPAPSARTVAYTAPSSRYDYDDDYEASGTGWYRVRRGDTLWEIARRHRMSLSRLAKLNGISTRSTIKPGQRLKVTGSASSSYSASNLSATGEYSVRYGDSLWSIAKKHSMTVSELAGVNGISTRTTLRPGQRLKVAGGSSPATSSASIPSGSRTYKVRYGDTIWDIAQRHGVSVDSILRANNLRKRSVIKPGQRLIIPGGGSA